LYIYYLICVYKYFFNQILYKKLYSDTFNKAKEDGNLGRLMYRVELIDDFERLDRPSLYNSPYICFRQDPDLMKKWMNKSQELKETKLYSWFNESIDKEKLTYDDEDIKSWYKTWYRPPITSNENQVSSSIISSSSAPDLFEP
jgi:hypothetical protein